MSEQPAALRLADELDAWEKVVCGSSVMASATIKLQQAAAELRRLHEVNQELLAALKAAKWFVGYCTAGMVHSDWVKAKALRVFGKVKDAISKGEQA